jgi:seryl-tRNA synthetase
MEMNSCLVEMERLHAKMNELKKQMKEEDIKEKEKMEKMEPNMAVMKNWLDTYNFNQEQKYDDYHVRKGIRKIPAWRDEDEDFGEVVEDFRKYRMPSTRPIDIFNNGGVPTQFMIDFIESTHNLFQIMQKRIDELELYNEV